MVIKQAEVPVEYEIITAKEQEIKYCRGCTRCFAAGACVLDPVDKFDAIKEKILKADLVVLGSPVYSTTITGQMKTFFDRLAYWTHLLKLAGKPGVSIVTASCNSVLDTSTYMKKIMQYLGLELICNIGCTIDIPRMLEDSSFVDDIIPSYVKVISDYINGNKVVKSNEFHEKYYQHLKNTYKIPQVIEHAEVRYWQETGYLNFQSYQKLLEHLQGKSYNISS